MPEHDPVPRPRWLAPALLAVLAALVAAYHLASHSASSELGAHPDEAAHFVTGLMFRDYLASGFHQPPLAYAANYYEHYPKIGLGVWPPFFYLVQAVWMLVFPATAQCDLWLMAALTLGLAAMLARALCRELGPAAAIAGGILLVSLPLVQMYSNMVMAEMLSALLMYGAALCLAEYLACAGKGGAGSAAGWSAAGFGILAGLAIMTKGTGLALGLTAPLAILFTRRFAVLKDWRLWMAALLVLVIAGPWTWHFRNIGHGGWEEPSPSPHYSARATAFYSWQLIVAGGWVLALPALAGAVTVFMPGAGRGAGMGAAVSLALVVSIWVFQSIMPVGLEARHLAPAMPALVFLALAGLNRFRVHWLGNTAPAALLVALFFGLALLPGHTTAGYGSLGGGAALSPFRLPRKEWHGFAQLAAEAVSRHCERMLVASDARGEGMFIAAVAMLDPHRPGWTADRASKLLASSTWSGGSYQTFYDTPAKAAAAVKAKGLQAVIIDSSLASPPPHLQMLQRAMADAASGYRQDRTAPITRDGAQHPGALSIYYAQP
jgi:hypothetical protein